MIAGRGFTVIVYEEGVPLQLFADGVTVIVETILVEPALVAVNEGKFPVPLAAERPMAVFELVHAKVAPAVGLENVPMSTIRPGQMVISAGTVTVMGGFTVTVTVKVGPVQVPAAGVTV